MDLGFYVIFVPITLLLIPTNRLMEVDYIFFLIMMLYMAVIHIINRRFNILSLLMRGHRQRAVGVLLLLVAITYFTSCIDIPDYRSGDDVPWQAVLDMRARTIRLLFFIDISFSVMLALVIELGRQRIEQQAVETEKNKARLALYKSQINPHFMFNTLNTLYGLFITNSDKTAEVFIKFTDIIKYMYANAEREKISIMEEIKYLREYIDLHTLRLGEQTKVVFNCHIDDNSVQIPPMILITFVENAFKYGVSSTDSSQIEIYALVERGCLVFKTKNRIFTRNSGSEGIGIENCRKRLELHYADRFELEREEADGLYNVMLKIEL